MDKVASCRHRPGMSAAFLPQLLLSVLAVLATAPTGRTQTDATDAAAPIASFHLPTGATRVLTRGDVALAMAFHNRRKDEGRAACEQLVKTTLVRAAAGAAGAWPSPAAVRSRWEELRQQMRAVGRDLEREPIFRNCGEPALLDYLAIDLAHEQLVRKQLELRDHEQVSPAMLELWLQEARQRTTVIDDPDQLPIGTAVRIGDQSVPMLELGMLLLRTSPDDEQDLCIRKVAVLDCLEALASAHDVSATDDEIQQELVRRRTMAQTDPRFRGLSFEQLLKAQGLTVEWLVQSRVFRAQVLQKKLVVLLHPRAALLAEIEHDRAAANAEYGPRRHLAILFARALDEPNALVPRDFAAAVAHLGEVRARLGQEPFATVARIESEDPRSKNQGGDCGWHVRRSKELPEPVLAAAWDLARDAVSEPIRTDDGCYLVTVLEIEPSLADDELIDRRRDQLVETMTRDLLAQAAITRPDGTPLDGTPVDGTPVDGTPIDGSAKPGPVGK